MRRQLSRMARRALIAALRGRYAEADRESKQTILDEFVEVSGYHRKHAIRMLGSKNQTRNKKPQEFRRLYGEAVLQALIVLWEAADRICGKRLKALLPVLIDAMERHGHLQLDEEVRSRLLTVSAATIDRLLSGVREKGKQRRSGIPTVLRKAIPVRTFGDWKNPLPGEMEADFVCHSGGTMNGSFVHTLVMTDIATGWTECVALVARQQHLVTEALNRVRSRLPFPLRAFDSDNDSAFINETVLDYCRQHGIEFTRSRPYRKNDQAWVEQKNGAIVRKLIEYKRFEGLGVAQIMTALYEHSRLYTNFLQPSFKLLSKTREGARIRKTYESPATPYERLIRSDQIPRQMKTLLEEQFLKLDPIHLLKEIRMLQAKLAATEVKELAVPMADSSAAFVKHLSTAWQQGEVRPTQRKRTTHRHWRTRPDAFQNVWSTLLSWLDERPHAAAKDLFLRLQQEHPGTFPDGQLRTLQRRVKQWRQEMARRLIFGTETQNYETPELVGAAGN